MALFVGKLDHIIIDIHAVGGKGKAEVFAFFFFNAAGIPDQALAHIPVHQRLAAEKVHFQIAAGTGIFNQKIQRAFSGFKAHKCCLAVEFALCGKAILAVQVAGVRHVQAQCLYHRAAVFKIKGMVGIDVGGKQLACIL